MLHVNPSRTSHTNELRTQYVCIQMKTGGDCNTWQNNKTATYCNAQQYTTVHYNTLQHTATHCTTPQQRLISSLNMNLKSNTLQRIAKHCNTLEHTVTYYKTHNTLQHAATRCNTLQHAATRCNTLQHTATPESPRGSVVGMCVCECMRACVRVFVRAHTRCKT